MTELDGLAPAAVKEEGGGVLAHPGKEQHEGEADVDATGSLHHEANGSKAVARPHASVAVCNDAAQPTLDQIYQQIMSQKRSQEQGPAPAIGTEPSASLGLCGPMFSGLGLSLRNSTLEQLLLGNQTARTLSIGALLGNAGALAGAAAPAAAGDTDSNAAAQAVAAAALLERSTSNAAAGGVRAVAPSSMALPAGTLSFGLPAGMAVNQALGLGGAAGLAPGVQNLAGQMHIMRSNTMEQILQSMSGGKELDELMFDWSSIPPLDQKFLEGLNSDMQAIEQAPPDVAAMRRTFTLERILSGAESDLMAMMLRPGAGTSGGGAADGAPGAPGTTSDAAAATAAAPGLRLLQMPDRLGGGNHTGRPSPLGRSSGASLPGSVLGAGGLAAGGGGGGGGGMQQPSGIGAVQRGDPLGPPAKRQKLPGAGPVARLGAEEAGPMRTWSQTLHDLAKAAAEIEGGSLDEEEGGAGGAGQGGAGADGVEEDNGVGPSGVGEDEEGRQSGEGEEEDEEGGLHEDEEGRGGSRGRGRGRHRGGPGGHGQASDDPDYAPQMEGPGDMDGREQGQGRPRKHMRLNAGFPAAEGTIPGMQGLGAFGGPGGMGVGGGGAGGVANNSMAMATGRLAQEVDRLTRENAMLQGWLDRMLGHTGLLQQANSNMKDVLLQACASKGIHADLNLLNMSLAHHRQAPLPEPSAVRIAAAVLGQHQGNVMAAAQQMMSIVMNRVSQ